MAGAFSSGFASAFDTAPAGPFEPGGPWPGTPGGAARDEWSGYVRVYVQAAIAAGQPFTMGPHAFDRLDAGNVYAAPAAAGVTAAPADRLWVDLSCDLTDLEITLGSSAGTGILSQSEAGTLTATLYDPDGKYDPVNPDTPFALNRHTRLTPGVPVRAWAEVIDDPAAATVSTYALFWGTADRWAHDWSSNPGERVAKLVATDLTKTWVRFDLPELTTPVGAGDTPLARLNRLAARYGWTGTVQTFGATIVTLQASTLAQSGWELVGRVAADELGFAYFVPIGPATTSDGVLALVAREVWGQRPPPAVTIGCGDGMFDIAVDVVPASFDAQLKNAAYVARTGGTQQTAKIQSSIDRFYEQSITRTDLGLADDTQAAAWATAIVTAYAYPQTSLDTIVLRPDVAPEPWQAWNAVLGKQLAVGLIRVVWDSAGYPVDTQVRLVGWTHKITADEWTVEWRTVAGTFTSAATTFHVGPHANDVLDAGFVLG